LVPPRSTPSVRILLFFESIFIPKEVYSNDNNS
jgi:hypothetical protein